MKIKKKRCTSTKLIHCGGVSCSTTLKLFYFCRISKMQLKTVSLSDYICSVKDVWQMVRKEAKK